MHPRLQNVRCAWAVGPGALGLLTGLLLGGLLLGPGVAQAQQVPPPSAVARVEGSDISIESGTAAANGTATAAPSIYVANGGVVTVHSGPARMTLFAGGEVDICGPAKLTVLQSSGAITLALNFGRVRVQLPPNVSLRVFTPSMVATPLEISGGARDISVGLSLDDSLCVLATSGAIQIEHQFSGEKLIVPQAGEFFLGAGKLLPVTGASGSCQCDIRQPQQAPPSASAPPEFATTPVLQGLPQVLPPPAPAAAVETPAEPPGTERSVEFSVLAPANEAHPVERPARAAIPAVPPSEAPVYTMVMPLVFSASAPVPPDDPTPDMVLLIREARVMPEWEFSGRVEAPELARAVQRALGEAPPAAAKQGHDSARAGKKKGGFWAALKRVFSGSSAEN
ncbi:MAG: hypothetical protein LAN59_09740 [Acidobacteriia bacterium]|nr:hypothetical protein [Terriglobia bacterium]